LFPDNETLKWKGVEMKTLAKAVMLLAVLGFCLPSYGEILVYKFTQNGTYWMQEGGEWRVDKGPWKGYMVVDLNYDDYTIPSAEIIGYGKGGGGKTFTETPVPLQLVRVEYGTKVQWVVMATQVDFAGQQITGGSLHMLAGQARVRNIGTGENQEIPNKLAGYGVEDRTDTGDRDIGLSTLSATLYPAWTYWANGDEGNQNFDATVQMIIDYLIDRGYTQRN
jgi:hypothetical protein